MIAFTGGAFAVAEEHRTTLASAGVGLEERPIRRLLARDDRLSGIELADGTVVERDVLFVHPPQRQVDLVRSLGLALDDKGFVRVDEATRETSVPGCTQPVTWPRPLRAGKVRCSRRPPGRARPPR